MRPGIEERCYVLLILKVTKDLSDIREGHISHKNGFLQERKIR